jgi:hypothetical protein
MAARWEAEDGVETLHGAGAASRVSLSIISLM